MKKAALVSGFICLFCAFTASESSATYVTFQNVWGNSITFVNMGFWNLSHTVEIGELWTSDYPLRPADAFPLNITAANPLAPGLTYTTPVIPWLPDGGFIFDGLGVAGDFGFTAMSDVVSPGHTVIAPGSSVVYALWPTGGPGVDGQGIPCDTCGTVAVMRISFQAGEPSIEAVPEPASFLLIGMGLAGLGAGAGARGVRRDKVTTPGGCRSQCTAR